MQIKRKSLQAIAYSGVILLFVASLAVADEPEAPRPNIVLFIADDLGYGELGCQGNQEIPTPHIDSIASNGVRFTSGYVTASFCSASRAGLMTGRWQTRFGYEFNPIGHHNEHPLAGLPMGQRTIANHLHDVGYATALIGKWHLGGHAAYHPQRRGIDEFFGFLHEGHYYKPSPYRGLTTMLRRRTLPIPWKAVEEKTEPTKHRWRSRNGSLILSDHMGHDEPAYDANNPILRGGQPIEEDAYLTDAFTREAVDFVKRTHERPFFLCVSYNAVHSPLQGAAPYMRKFAGIEDIQRRIFAAMLANLDDSVGAVLATLNDYDLEENTLIFFISDNGGPTKELTSSNLPLRGGKGEVFEGGIRVPFMMQWKGVIPAAQTYEQPVVSLDIFATSAAVAGKPVPTKNMDGVNLLPYIKDEPKERTALPHKTLFWRMRDRTAIRHGDWKLLRHRKGDWQLFHLSEDLGEANDLANAEPQRLQELIDVWAKLNAEMIPPVWDPRMK